MEQPDKLHSRLALKVQEFFYLQRSWWLASNDMNEELATLQAMMETLVDIMGADSTRAYTLVSYVQKVLPCQDPLGMGYAVKIFAQHNFAPRVGIKCSIISGNSCTTRYENFLRFLQQAQKGLKLGTFDAIHGSLLGIKEVISEGLMLMCPQFQEISDLILTYKDHQEALVRHAVVELILTLASYNSTEHSSTHLYQCHVASAIK
ncbi:hypothetical protein O181_026297 [Austropuccinia psidii MF-1]|uniref:Uncharacterized protein n=1 Tax=Austropuccinia psidii MF-1 TaxID=1389203 RepID=A0A9Q3H0N4_9BASI|nr:hypothetical protein [Austropuccinia psidii MF-1]